jgi:hypothetical protein
MCRLNYPEAPAAYGSPPLFLGTELRIPTPACPVVSLPMQFRIFIYVPYAISLISSLDTTLISYERKRS